MIIDTRVDAAVARLPLVVVVDDDDAVREAGDAALRALAGVAGAVLVVDWRMPGLDGAQVARRAR